ncbi:MAG: ester cyclase [Thermoleophilia bacterium]
MTKTDLVESYVAAWRERDPAAISAHFAADGVRRWEVVVPPVIGGPNRFRGPAEIAVPIRGLLGAIPDLDLEVPRLVETADGAICEWRHSGMHTGSWNDWAPQGERVEFAGVSVYRIAGDMFAEECIYFDPDLLVRNWAVPLGTLAGVGLSTLRQGRAIRRARKRARA